MLVDTTGADTTAASTAGTVLWAFAADKAHARSLAAGETDTEVFTITVDDGHGGTTSQDVSVTVVGVNDAPTVTTALTTPTRAFSELANTTGDTADQDQASGKIAFADPDLTDTHAVTQSSPAFTWSGGTLTDDQKAALTAAGALSLAKSDSTGTGTGSVDWKYQITDSALDFLAKDETLTVKYDVTIDDHHGATTTQTVTVTITGTNDAPTIDTVSTNVTGAITEDAQGHGIGNETATGTIAFKDADLNDTHTVNAGDPSFVWKSGETIHTLSPSQVAELASHSTLILDETDSNGTGAGSVGWTFQVDDSAIDFLAQGETLTVTYNVTLTDNNGASITQPLTLAVAGTGINDAPTIIADSTTATGAITETANTTGSSATDSVSGTIAFADVDLNDTHTGSKDFVSAEWQKSDGTTVKLSDPGALTLGTLNDTSKTVGWTYAATDGALDFLAAGDKLTVSYNVTIDDGHPGGSASQLVTVTINGTNDVPVIGGVHTGAVTEDVAVDASGKLATAGVLTIADVDAGQSNFTAQAGTLGSNGYGAFSLAADGSWTYTANDSQAAIQQLGAGQSITDSFTAVSSDGSASQLVTVTINGTNDTAVIGNPTVADVTEDVSVLDHRCGSGSGIVPDLGDGRARQPRQPDAGGERRLHLHGCRQCGAVPRLGRQQGRQFHGDGARRHQQAGQLHHPRSFTIHGTNDAAVIGDPTVADVTEDVSVNAAGNLTASGTLSISDADQNQAFFQTGVSGAAGNLGSLALAANGSYTYTVADSTVQYLGVNSTKVDSFTVTALDGTSKQISFTIHGTNDAPSAPIDANAADNHVLAHATNGASVGITAFATDPDAGDTITYQWASNPNNLFAIDANTGVVTVADGANLNAGTYTISVRAVDNHNLAGPATSFAIAVGAGLAGTLSGLSNGHGVENTAVVVASLTDGGPDVLSAATYSWQVSKDGVSWYQEGGGIGQSSFTPSAADFGDQLRVAISYNGDALTLGAGTVLDDPTEVIAVSGGNWKQAQTWSTHGVPGANDDVVLSQNLGSKGVEVNDQEFAHSLSIESAGAILKEGGTLIVSGPITVLNGTLQLQGGATLEAGSIFGTISGSGTNTIEGAGGANTWAEIVSSATINTSANGWLAIDSGATLALGAGTHTENVKFLNNFADNGLTTGTLVIASGATFTGEVFNFHGVNGGLSDTIDFAGLQYTTGQMQVSASFSQGTDITTVTVTNNALHQSTSLKLDGSYTASQFALSQDSGTGTLLKDPPLDPGMAAASHDSFDFAFDSNTALGSSSGPLAANTVIGQLDAISASGHSSAFWLATGSSPELTLSSSGTLSAGKDGAASGTYAVDVVAQDQSTGTSSATQANVWIGGKDAANTPAALASDSNKLIALALDGNHSLQGGSGNDVLIAGSGNDTFVFQANFGHDTISNFKVDTDVIAIDHSVFADFQALLVAAHDDGHGNTVIAPDASNSITVKNVTVAQLAQHQGDFHFM